MVGIRARKRRRNLCS